MITNGKHPIRRLVVSVLIFLTFFLCSCSPTCLNWNPQGDWDYELCHDYYIMRINSTEIALYIANGVSFSDVVDSYITSFCYNDDYIAVRRLKVGQDAMFEEIMDMDFEQAAFYLVNAQNHTVFGPILEKAEFDYVCKEQHVGQLGEWINTYPAPEGARY